MRLDRIVPRSNLGPGMPKPLQPQGFFHFWLRQLGVGLRRGVRKGASPAPPLPEGAALHRCHRTRQGPLPDQADAMATRAPREVPTGLAGAQEVTKTYAEGKYPERGARTGISTGVL